MLSMKIGYAGNMIEMEKSAKIYVVGHAGMVELAIERKLTSLRYANFVVHTSKQLDLLRQEQVELFFPTEKLM